MRGGRRNYHKLVIKGLIFIGLLFLFSIFILYGCTPARKMKILVSRDTKIRAKMDSIEKYNPDLGSLRKDKLTIFIPEKQIDAETDLKVDSNYLDSINEERIAKNVALYFEEYDLREAAKSGDIQIITKNLPKIDSLQKQQSTNTKAFRDAYKGAIIFDPIHRDTLGIVVDVYKSFEGKIILKVKEKEQKIVKDIKYHCPPCIQKKFYEYIETIMLLIICLLLCIITLRRIFK